MEQKLTQILRPYKKIAMEYSPKNAIPYISVVDAGTTELVRSLGVEIVSSAALVQRFKARWTPEQLAGHLETSTLLIEIVHKAFDVIRTKIQHGNTCTEWDVQEFILAEFESNNLCCFSTPNCSVNHHSADPHYQATSETALEIHAGDFVLIDLWAKKKTPGSVYADYTWTGYVGQTVPGKYAEIFEIIKEARDKVVDFLRDQLSSGEVVYGWQADDVCRNYITDQGYGDQFIHRTGHSIGEDVHGWGANLDNLETRDERELLPETCFSIEPGIYFPREFGIRSEINAYIRKDKTLLITGTPAQQQVIPILAS
jgi:Xaa-Pro aminopeptidase